MRTAVLLLAATFAAHAQTSTGWQLVWADDFSGPANSAPDPTKWTYDLGNNGWGNRELENYTNSRQNSYIDGNGNLVIQALSSGSGYTSARLKTEGLFTIAYGKIEARIKIPYGQGLWPAFWMLGANIDAVSWPNCGEIDIMENIGKEPSIVHGTIHGTGDSGVGIGGEYTLPGNARFADDFHLFTVEWSPQTVQFSIDGNAYETVTQAMAGKQWVFDHPFFLLLNVAVGGSWPGNPDNTTTFPQTMTVDYVHVYRSTTQPVVEPGGVLDAASFHPAVAPGSLGTIFGTGLSDATYSGIFDTAAGAFPTSVGGISVSVNSTFAHLTYVDPGQINFQIPQATPVGPAAVDVHVIRNGLVSNSQTITFQPAAPSAFAVNGTAIVTCAGGVITAGANCTLWGNGFGPTQTSYPDGTPAPPMPDPLTSSPCTLSVAIPGGLTPMTAVTVTYCGAAPGLVIDQLNFVYPAGLTGVESARAAIQIGSASGDLKLPGAMQ